MSTSRSDVKRKLPRFTSSNLSRILSSKQRSRTRTQAGYQYEKLEPKQMLTADIGLSFTSIVGGVNSNANPPNISGAVGDNHIVQFVNDGVSIYDKTDGSLLSSSDLETFFGNAGTGPLGDGVSLSQPRVVYDSFYDRWYAIAVDNTDLNDDAFGVQGNGIHIAASNTPDPTGSWKGALFQYDIGRFDADGNFVFLDEFREVTLSIDTIGLSITGQVFTATLFGPALIGTSIASLPQNALFGGAIEMSRAEVIDRAAPLAVGNHGLEIQIGLENVQPELADQTSDWGLAIEALPDNDTFPTGIRGSQLFLTEFARPGIPDVRLDLAVAGVTPLNVDDYREPDVVRQPVDIIRDRFLTQFNATVAQDGDFLYAAHAVRGDYDEFGTNLGNNSGLGINTGIRWYKINTATQAIVEQGSIQDTSGRLDFVTPSISVSPTTGAVAIGYTATGLDLFPSSYVSIGVPIGGIGSAIAFNNPTPVKAGESSYIDSGNHFWGRYTTTLVDPADPNTFWTFQQYTNASNQWAVEVTSFKPVDTNPVLTGNNLDNVIELNQVGANLEVVIDGVLTGVYDASTIGTLTIDGGGGFDQFIVNVPDLDAPGIVGSYILVGDGDDTIRSNATSDTIWVFDGGNGVNINSGRVLANGMVEFYGGSGNDRFEFPTSNYAISVSGGGGADVFNADQNITGNLNLFGESGDDSYRVPASSFNNVNISDSIGAENDSLVAVGTDGQDSFFIDATTMQVNGITVPVAAAIGLGIESFDFAGLGDVDTFDINTTVRGVRFFGDGGNDIFNVEDDALSSGSSDLFINGGLGRNSLNVTFLEALASVKETVQASSINSITIDGMTNATINVTATGGSFSSGSASSGIQLFGSDVRDDEFNVLAITAGDDLIAHGLTGDDRFLLRNTVDGQAEFRGGAGDDYYLASIDSIFDLLVTDSVDSENDTFYVSLTSGDDTIEVNASGYVFNGVNYPSSAVKDAGFSGIENFDIDGLDGDDTFDVTRTTTPANLFGSGGDDVFNITDATATPLGGSSLLIDGGSGTNQMFIDRNGALALPNPVTMSTSNIAGMTIADIDYQATGGIFSLIELYGSNIGGVGDSNYVDEIIVSGLADPTLLRIFTFEGDDIITVADAALGDIEIEGGDGSDTYFINVDGVKTRTVTITDINSGIGVDNFDPDIDASVWESIVNATANTNFVGSDGNSLYFDGGGARSASTFPLDTTGGGTIGFDLIIGDGTNGGEDADLVEEAVFLEYSIDGVNWVNLEEYGVDDPAYALFNRVEVDIPTAARTTATQFRWIQPNNSGTGFDQWAIDNVDITVSGSAAGDDRVEVIFTNAADVIDINDNGVTSAQPFGEIALNTDRVLFHRDIDTLAAVGRDGDDIFNVTGVVTNNLELRGQVGDDTYTIATDGNALNSQISIIDSVNAENDQLTLLGTAAVDTFVINDDTIFINGQLLVDSSLGLGEITGVESISLDGREEDDIFQINSTTRTGFSYLGSEGNDQYFITETSPATVSHRIFIDGGMGNNEMFVSRAAAISGLNGADAGVEVIVQESLISGMTNAAIEFQATDGVFSLIDLQGTLGIDDKFDDVFRVEGLLPETLMTIDALGAQDTIEIKNTARGDVTVEGGTGDDTFIVGLNAALDRRVEINDSNANLGNDRIEIQFDDNAQDLEVDGDIKFGYLTYELGLSFVDFDETIETLALYALGGDDRFTVTNSETEFLELHGGAGDDSYDVGDIFGSTQISIIDSVDAENDSLVMNGTSGDDVFQVGETLIRINGVDVTTASGSNIVGIESFEFRGREGDDRFNITSATRGFTFFGDGGNDEFLIHDTGADAGSDRIHIDGGTGQNFLSVTRIDGLAPAAVVVNEAEIKGMANAIIDYVATGGSFSLPSGAVGGILLTGTETDDVFLVQSLLAENSLSMIGLGGREYFRFEVDVLGDTRADGGEGNDRYVYFLTNTLSRTHFVRDTGAGGIDRVNTFLSDISDTVTLNGERVQLLDDAVSLDPNIETLEILAGEGRDRIVVKEINVNTVQIKGQDGDDTFVVDRGIGIGNLIMIGDDGDDVFDIVATSNVGFFNAWGIAGNDYFRVGEDSYRDGILDGGSGNDLYDVSFADKSRRHMTVRDSGTDADDQIIVRATTVASTLDIRANGVSSAFQTIASSRRIERFTLIGTQDKDVFSMYASPASTAIINTVGGDDILSIFGNSGANTLTANLGVGDDVGNVVATLPDTTTTVNTGENEDLVNLGSALVADTGNLDRLQGAVTVNLGSGDGDRLVANDAGSGGPHGYDISSSRIQNRDSVRVRDSFAGVNLSGAEFFHVRSNEQFNTFFVTPSVQTQFLLNGNAPLTNSLTVLGAADGRELSRFGLYNGRYDFNTFRSVSFENFLV